MLKARNLDPYSVRDTRMVPIPTDGVFAEAVRGTVELRRETRHHPLLELAGFARTAHPAPELAPVSTESRALPENLTPGQLGPSTLNIVNPTSLPDPAGIGARRWAP